MAKRKELIARVRYEKGIPPKKGIQEVIEGFVLESWDEDLECWGLIIKSYCRAIDGTSEKDFIHWSFLYEVFKCIEFGYSVHWAKV